MTAITKTLVFSSLSNADPATPPSGYSLSTGSDPAAIFSGSFRRSSGVQSVWIDNTPLSSSTISAGIALDSPVFVDAHGACLVNDSTGNGWMVITGTGANNFRIFELAASQIGGGGLLDTFSVTPINGASIELSLTGTTLTVKQNGTTVGSYAGASGHAVNRAGVVARGNSAVISMTSSYDAAQTITSINGGNPITAGQTGIPIESSGFTAKPTGVTATYSAGAKSISATIGSGTATSFNISIQDRVEAEDWPPNGDTLTFTFTYGSESASGTQALVKKANETVLTFAGAITSDPATSTYWLTQDGFTVEGGENVYKQPPPTGAMPSPDLVLTADGGGSVKEASTFPSWFRPSTGTGAGNVYEYQWVITEAGISPVGSGGLTSMAITAVGLTSAGVTSVSL